MEEGTCDIIVLGGGPAGMTAAIYAKRANLDVVLLETNVTGGLVNSTYTVENFPSYPEIHGMELMEKMREHVDHMGVEVEEVFEVIGLELGDFFGMMGSKITIVEEYEWVDLPLVEEPTESSAQDPEQIKKQEELKKWYQGLTEEQLSFVRSAIQEEEYKRLGLEEENRANEVDKLTAYLKKNLSKTQYTYISDEYTSVRIGIPSNKYRETIESLYRKYSKTNPNSVTVFYELCPLSLKELEKAMEELQKDSQLKKMMENNLGALFINQSWIDLYWTNGVPKGFEEWLSNSQYQKLIYVRENQKPLLLDSPGL